MSCKIGKNNVLWKLKGHHIEGIYKTFDKNFESAGKIEFNLENNNMISSKIKKINEGDKNSVVTPLSIINYHVHPYQCYIDEKVIWGWPSGEDLRQTILFAIGGNFAHIVFSLEGLYVMEVNPCFIKFLQSLPDQDKSVIIAWIEILGKSTHELRGLDVNKRKLVKPQEWLKFVNNLNVDITQNTKKCGIIKCDKVTFFDNNKLVFKNLEHYLNLYYPNIELDYTSKSGHYKYSHKINIKKFREILIKVRQFKFECGKHSLDKKKWKKGQIFNVQYFEHKEFPKKGKPEDIFDWIKKKNTIKPIDSINMVSNKTLQNCDIKDTYNNTKVGN